MSDEDRASAGGDPAGTDADPEPDGRERDELEAHVELLERENERIRAEYARTQQSNYRRTALGFGLLGVLAVAAGTVFPASQTLFFILGGIGLFSAVMTYYLTPEQFVAASTSERVYAAHAAGGAELVADLDLQPTAVYVPTDGYAPNFAPVRLFVPEHPEYVVPDADDLGDTFVVPAAKRARGVSLPPTGAALLDEFGAAVDDATTPAALAERLSTALVEGVELADRARPDLDDEGGRLLVEIHGSVYGPVDRFDHPVASFLASGLALGLDAPVRLETIRAEEGSRYLVVCTWENVEAEGDAERAWSKPSPAQNGESAVVEGESAASDGA